MAQRFHLGTFSNFLKVTHVVDEQTLPNTVVFPGGELTATSFHESFSEVPPASEVARHGKSSFMCHPPAGTTDILRGDVEKVTASLFPETGPIRKNDKSAATKFLCNM
jgi:hypothetical protein